MNAKPDESDLQKTDIWLITGGGRSGKSAFAEKITKEKISEEIGKGKAGRPGVLYIATGVAMDEEMKDRIMQHRVSRPPEWITWECYRGFADIESEFEPNEFGTIMLDCIGNMLMGVLFDEESDPDVCTLEQFDHAEKLSTLEIDTLCSYAQKHGKRLVFVTNEIGMGIIPETRYTRYYRDALGRVNQYAAKVADNVILMVAGIPVTLK